MKSLKLTLIACALIVVIVVCVVAFVSFSPLFDGWLSVEQITVIDADTIEQSIREIAELSTLSYVYTDVGMFSEQTEIKLFGLAVPGTGDRLS